MLEGEAWTAVQTIAEHRIAEAQRKGAFDNLPGTGKPLVLEDMSHIPPELRMACKILRNAGCLPPALEERKELGKLADMLEHCAEEQERVHQMEKLRYLILRAKERFQRPFRLDQEDQYYDRLLDKIRVARPGTTQPGTRQKGSAT